MSGTTPRPWVHGDISGQCHIDHRHGTGACRYDWKVTPAPDSHAIAPVVVTGYDDAVAGNYDFEVGGIVRPADAALIVEAVNNYDGLRAALLHLAMRRHEHSAGCDGCVTVGRMTQFALRDERPA